MRSKKEVIRSHAARVIAAMTYFHAVRDWAVCEFESKAVRKKSLTVAMTVSVTSYVECSGPWPASIGA